MSLLQQIKVDQLIARKAKDSTKASLLTTLIGEAQTISKSDGNRELADVEVMALIKKFLKGLNEMLGVPAGLLQGGALEKIVAEINILATYMPSQMTGDSLESAIRSLAIDIEATTKKDMGRLMQAFKAKYDGQYDGKEASAFVKLYLAQ